MNGDRRPPTQPAGLTRQQVPKTYARIAPFYNVFARMFEQKAHGAALHLADIADGETVLEVAVGTGHSFSRLVGLNPSGHSVGVDVTAAMLERAGRRLSRAGVDPDRYTLLAGDAYSLEFEDATFDVLLNSYMFDMLPEDDFIRVLLEFKRVLKPGGRLVLVAMTRGHRFYNRLWERLYTIHPPLLGGCRGVVLKSFVESAGLTMRRRLYLSEWTFPSEVLLCGKP